MMDAAYHSHRHSHSHSLAQSAPNNTAPILVKDWRDSLVTAATQNKIRGRLGCDVALAATSWFGVGGAADILFKPIDINDLQEFLNILPHHVSITILGATSNLLLRDGGIRGAVIRLGRDFAKTSQIMGNPTQIKAGAAALDVSVAEFAAGISLADFEFLVGIPGSIGGAVAMNAGAFGSETKNILQSIEIIDRGGTVSTLSASNLKMSYRSACLPENALVVSAVLQGKIGDRAEILSKMDKIKQERDASQPIRSKTGGSSFKNPPPASVQNLPPNLHKAWQLIDAAGCRGLRIGAAMVSEKHCNFLLNLGGSTAREIEQLGEEIRRRVADKFGIQLEWEIKILGDAANLSGERVA